jgi:AhpC/TSA family
MKPPIDTIAAPPFPRGLRWINVAPLRMEQQVGRPVLIEFWDFCRPNSIRTLPYVKAWHERYEPMGLRVIGVHASGFPPSGDPDAVEAAVGRLQIPYPVVVDAEYAIWREYGNLGWPARYLFNQQGRLFDYHYGEGAYDETERVIQGLLGVEQPTLSAVRPEDAPDAMLVSQSEDVPGLYNGPYEAGGVWAVLSGEGTATANGSAVIVDHPGCYQLISHPHSTTGVLRLQTSGGVTCHGVCFTPGVAP